jgi:clan AA aspartic protease (TIGR02281 family)
MSIKGLLCSVAAPVSSRASKKAVDLPNRHARRALRCAGVVLGGVALSSVAVGSAQAQAWLAPLVVEIGWPEILAAGIVYCVVTGCGADNPAQAGVGKGGSGKGGNTGSELRIPVGSYNQCEYDITANGHSFPQSVFDSGASGHLTFGKNHARDLGFDPGKLSYSHVYGSANGDGHEAKVTLRELKIGNWTLHDVPAVITEATQSQVLVGLEILGPLNFRLSKDYCYVSLPQAAVRASVHPSPSAPLVSDVQPAVPHSTTTAGPQCSEPRLPKLRGDPESGKTPGMSDRGAC